MKRADPNNVVVLAGFAGDAAANLELLYRDPKISSMTPLPVRSRVRPPVQPSKAHYAATNVGRYFAIAGDYEPQVEGWRRLAVDRLMDRIFKEPNDLVVPKAGTYEANGSKIP